MCVRFFLTPFLIHKLGDEEYGIWILILSFIGYMELLNLGFYTGIVRYISKFTQVKDNKKINEIFNTGLFMFTLLALIIIFLVLILASYSPSFFEFNENYVYKIIFIIVGINLAFEFIFYIFSAVLAGKQKFLESNIIESLIFLVRAVLVVLFLMEGYKLLALALIFISCNLVRGVILSIYSLKISPELIIDLKYIKMDSFRALFSYTIYNLFINISVKMNSTGSIIIIGYFLSAGAVTIYSIANMLIKYLHTFMMQIQKVLIPHFSQLEAQNNIEQVHKELFSITRYTLIIVIPIIYIFIFYGESFIELWVGKKYAHLSGGILVVLAISKFFHISQMTIETALKAISKHKNLSYIKLLESITILILSIILVKRYDLIGVAYANAISMTVFNFVIIPVYACYLLKISVARYYFQCIFKNIYAIIPLILIIKFINYPINSYAVFLMFSLLSTVIFFIASYFLVLDLEDRKFIYSLGKIKR